MRDNRTIEQFHADRESGSGCPEVDGGPHYFAFIDPTVDYRICIDCCEPEPKSTGSSSTTSRRSLMSNGSEHTPERCVHAVDGPDWAGLREPVSWKERAIAAEAENEKLRENRGWDGDWRTLGQTEEESRRILMTWTKAQLVARTTADQQRSIQHENWVAHRLASAEAERDALQARLDAMTVEWHTTRSVNGTGSRTQVRSVTPWTVVPEGDTNA